MMQLEDCLESRKQFWTTDFKLWGLLIKVRLFSDWKKSILLDNMALNS